MSGRFFALSAASFLFLSCGRMEPVETSEPQVDSQEIPVSFEFSVSHISKSSISQDESRVSNVNLFAYRDGILEGSAYVRNSSSLELTLVSGSSYRIYALANVGEVDAPIKESDLLAYRHYGSLASFGRTGFPMAAIKEIEVGKRDLHIRIPLVRLVSRITFNVDASAIPGFKVTSVSVKKMPVDVAPFSENSSASKTADGDYATESDLAKLNTGGTAVFYMLENCQGVLLEGNADQWEKVPENIPAEKAGLCTYMEVSAVLDGSSGVSGPAIYRFYLGQDVTSDFNIYRNTDNFVTLVATEAGLGRVSWRVDATGLEPVELPVVAAGELCRMIYTDEDGNLRNISVGKESDWEDVCYGNGRYVAVGGSSSYMSGMSAVSSDGKTWNYDNDSFGYGIKTVIFGNGHYLAAGESGLVSYSYDGRNWTDVLAGTGNWNSAAYDSGIFVLGGDMGKIAVSYDMRNWNELRVGEWREWKEVLFCNGKFVAIADGYVATSDNGVNWKVRQVPDLLCSAAAYGNGMILVIDPQRKIHRSDADAEKWITEKVRLDNSYNAMTFARGQFAAAGNRGMVGYSSDGRQWTERNAGTTAILNGICPMPE